MKMKPKFYWEKHTGHGKRTQIQLFPSSARKESAQIPSGFRNGTISGFSPKIHTETLSSGTYGAGMERHGRDEDPWK